jgi:hypothetical protein
MVTGARCHLSCVLCSGSRAPSCAAMAPAGGEPTPLLSDFQPETIRGTPGFVRVGRTRTGTWWLIGPDDRPFLACDAGSGAEASWAGPAVPASAWPAGTVVVDGGAPSARVGRWLGLIHFRPVEPGAAIHLQGVHLPDVFDPGWAQACAACAPEACRPGLGDARLVGWLPDPDLQWRQSARGLPSPALLQVCLSLEPRFAAYHAAWEFVLAAHGGDLAAVATAWATPLPNRESLRQLTHADHVLPGAGFRHDDDRFTREFARLYFAAVAAAIRAQDPAHLVIGTIPTAGPAAVGEGATPLVDLLLLGSLRPRTRPR